MVPSPTPPYTRSSLLASGPLDSCLPGAAGLFQGRCRPASRLTRSPAQKTGGWPLANGHTPGAQSWRGCQAQRGAYLRAWQGPCSYSVVRGTLRDVLGNPRPGPGPSPARWVRSQQMCSSVYFQRAKGSSRLASRKGLVPPTRATCTLPPCSPGGPGQGQTPFSLQPWSSVLTVFGVVPRAAPGSSVMCCG